ncbi:peptidase M28 [Sorangium cellulosum]|uniref:Peptidase M28 n=1 Tax=Sorangium cellulosum TaxID=56 RepID=A0A2L0F8U4_SORCE|nr:peptidase M28 [Sorangium cellulosum]
MSALSVITNAATTLEEARSIARLRPRYGRRLAAAAALLLAGLGVIGACVSQPFVAARPPSAPELSADPARLERDVRKLVETFRPRGYRHIEQLDRAAAYLGDELRAAGGRVTEQLYDVEGRTYRNVLARFGPASPARVVVGAHYDAANDLPGADDNASGVAGLLELGRMLGRAPLRGDVELVAFTLEEPPYFRSAHMGSARHAGALRAAGVEVRAMISLEMIGYFTDEEGSQAFPLAPLAMLYPTKGNFVAVVGNLEGLSLVRLVKGAMRGATDLPAYSLSSPALVQGVDWSDHRSYWDAGYPAVMVTDTAFLRNRRYHTAKDTPDTLDYSRAAKVVTGVAQAVLALANE